MKACLLVQSADGASTRHRVLGYRALLAPEITACETHVIPRRRTALKKLVNSLDPDTLILYQKKTLRIGESGLFARFRHGFVYDVDDAVFYRDPFGGRGYRSMARALAFTRTCRAARLVIAGNEFLAERARRYTPRVAVIPTPVDTARIRPGARGEKDELTIGWIGSRGTLGYLEKIAPVLVRLGGRFRNVKLKIVSDKFIAPSGLKVEKIPWSEDGEARELASLDIGLMPLDDHPFSRGKCAFKILQYMAAGIPAVVSPVGMNATVVRDGINGFHASNDDEWFEKVALLIEDAGLRTRLGTEGRRIAEREYDTRVLAAAFKRALLPGGALCD